MAIVGAGVCLALGAGHGVATAEPDSSDAGPSSATSQSTQPAGSASTDAKPDAMQRDSTDGAKEVTKPTSAVSESTVTVKGDLVSEKTVEPEEAQPATRPQSDAAEQVAAKTAQPATRPQSDAAEQVAAKTAQPATRPQSDAAEQVAAKTVEPASASAVPAMTAAPPQPNLINVVGTLVFTVLTLPLRLLEQPPVVPPGYSVTVGESTLDIGCGCGQKVDARWYFPEPDAHGAAVPQSIVYLQHGFIRSNSAMSAMAVELAERTNSVVVTPTLTSNPFTSDGCWINGEPMQRAVADLFAGDREALTASAVAAGWTGDALPTRFVLAGHSAGGGLAAAAAGYAVNSHTASNLLLVIMLDGVPTGDALPVALAKLSGGPNGAGARQVLLISSPPYLWNSNGLAAEQLVAARPGQFVGVQLVGGSHVDYEGDSSDLLAEIACGFSRPENVRGAQNLAVDWINDAIAGRAVAAPGGPGETVTIPTVAGNAAAVVLGAQQPALRNGELST